MPTQDREDRIYIPVIWALILAGELTWFHGRLFFPAPYLNLAVFLAPLVGWRPKAPKIPLNLSLCLLALSVAFLALFLAAHVAPKSFGEWAWYFGYTGQAAWFASVGCWIEAARQVLRVQPHQASSAGAAHARREEM